MQLKEKLSLIKNDTKYIVDSNIHPKTQDLAYLLLKNDVPYLINKLNEVIKFAEINIPETNNYTHGYKEAMEDLKDILYER